MLPMKNLTAKERYKLKLESVQVKSKMVLFLSVLKLKYDWLKIIGWNLSFFEFMFGTNSICYQRPKAGYET